MRKSYNIIPVNISGYTVVPTIHLDKPKTVEISQGNCNLHIMHMLSYYCATIHDMGMYVWGILECRPIQFQ